MHDLPMVTVITPSFNNGRFLEENIISVKNQNYISIEHIIIDAESKDNTIDVLRQHNESVNWISEPDRGFADAVNKGVRMSSGSILTILNSDDSYSCPNAVQTAVKGLREYPDAGIVFGDYMAIDERGRILTEFCGHGKNYSFNDMLCSRFVFPQNSTFFRREALESIGGELDIKAEWCADFDLWLRIGLRYPIVWIPKVLSTYRRHIQQRNFDLNYVLVNNPMARRYVLSKIFSHPNLPAVVRMLKNRAYAETYWRQANALASFGMSRKAFGSLLKAAKFCPYLVISPRILSLLKIFVRYTLHKKIAYDSDRNSPVPYSETQPSYKWWQVSREG